MHPDSDSDPIACANRMEKRCLYCGIASLVFFVAALASLGFSTNNSLALIAAAVLAALALIAFAGSQIFALRSQLYRIQAALENT